MWFKYPNPYAEHVRSIDVLDHRVCPHTGVVYIERLIQLHQNIPRWIEKVSRTLMLTQAHGYWRVLICMGTHPVPPRAPQRAHAHHQVRAPH